VKKRLTGWGLFFLRNIWWIQEKALPLYLVTKNIHKPTNIEFYMKRILFTVAAMVMGVVAWAQNDVMTREQADKLDSVTII
jgi:hypothetical protein